MKNRFILIIFLLVASLISGQEQLKNLVEGKNFSLDILGDIKTFHVLDKNKITIVAVDGVILKVDNMVTSAKRVAWLPTTQDIYLEGDIEVKGDGYIFRAQQMTYNLKEKKGVIIKPKATLRAPDQLNGPRDQDDDVIEIEKGRYLFIEAKKAEITKNQFLLNGLKITTNGYEKPFYHVSASTAIYEDNQFIQSWNNYLKIGKIPIFYFPYLSRDIKNNWPWIKVKLDHDSRLGLSGEAQLKIFFEENVITTTVNPMELRGTLAALTYERDNDKTQVYIKAEGIREHWKPESRLSYDNLVEGEDFNDDTLTNEDRYRLHLAAKQKLMWNFSFDLEIDKIDSTNDFIWKNGDQYEKNQSAAISPFEGDKSELKKGAYRRDYYRSEFYEFKSPESMGQLKWIKGPYAARMIYKLNINEFKFNEEKNNDEELEIKPGFLFDSNSAQILDGLLPVYFDSHIRLEALEKEMTDLNNQVSKISTERAYVQAALQTRYSFFDAFHFNAYSGIHDTGYSDIDIELGIKRGDGLLGDNSINLDLDYDAEVENTQNRFALIFGGSLNFTLNKNYAWSSKWFGFNGLTHRITPVIEYYGTSTPNKETDELPQFDTFDVFEKDDLMIIRLNQQFLKSEDMEDWILWRTWSNYYFNREGSQNGFQTLSTELQFHPLENLELRAFYQFLRGQGLYKNYYRAKYENKKMSLTLWERWEEGYPWQTDGQLDIKIGPRYRLYFGGTFLNKIPPDGNHDKKGLVEFHVGVTRRVHELSFTFEFKHDRLFDEKSFGLFVRLF